LIEVAPRVAGALDEFDAADGVDDEVEEVGDGVGAAEIERATGEATGRVKFDDVVDLREFARADVAEVAEEGIFGSDDPCVFVEDAAAGYFGDAGFGPLDVAAAGDRVRGIAAKEGRRERIGATGENAAPLHTGPAAELAPARGAARRAEGGGCGGEKAERAVWHDRPE